MASAAKHKCKICKKNFADASGLRHHVQLHSSDKPYSCQLCSYTGKTLKYLNKHVKTKHVAPEAHECSYCGRKFHYLSKLKEHLPIHTNSRPYKCDVCGKGFNSYFVLSTHKNIHKDVKPFKCLYCDYMCNDSSTLRKHHKRHTDREQVYQCEQCLKNFKKKADLRSHISEVHLKVDMKTKSCNICGKMFKTIPVLNSHIKVVHNKMYETKCDICGIVISNKYNLKAHLRSHIDLKPFVCGFVGCDKRYKDKSTLMKHSMVHYPERQRECEVCGKRFTRAYRYRRHLELHQPRAKTVACDLCGVSFYTKNYLRKHILYKHVLRVRYECDACGFSAHNKPGLVRHIRAGHDVDLTCKICKKLYKKHAYLKSHYWNTHFIRYKMSKMKKMIKEAVVAVKNEPIEEDASLEQTESDKNDITRDSDAEQAAQVKELMRTAVEATSDKLENLFKDLLHPPEYVTDGNDSALLCDTACEKKAQEQMVEMLTKAQLQDGKRRKILKKVTIDSDINDNKSNTRLDLPNKLNGVISDSQIPNASSNLVSVSENKYDITNDLLTLNGVNVVGVYDAGHVEDASTNDKETKTMKIIDKDSKSKVSKKGKKTKAYRNIIKNKNVKKYCSDAKKIVKRNYKMQNRIVMGTRKNMKANETEKDVKGENSTESNIEIGVGNSTGLNTDSGQENSDAEDKDQGASEQSKQSMGIILNSHQCYECFKLFETKEKLLDHCREHYSLCNEIILKKCPFCDFVTHGDLPRHVRLMHKVDLIYRPSLKEKENESGSRYFYNIGNEAVDKIDIIPSVKNLNRRAYIKLDRLKRQKNIKNIQKTKLIKKQGEWIVEKRDVNIKASDIVIPDLKKIEGDYFGSLKSMATLAKKEGKKFLYPCNGCEKICQTLAALKLHYRHHDPDKKPFRPKVWKHKIKGQHKTQEGKLPEIKKSVDTKRYETPKPIVNKHKCDPKLMEFYKNNIKGGDIEFWQFLKIFNRMTKDNVNDFKDLENTKTFGLHIPIQTEGKESPEKTREDIISGIKESMKSSQESYKIKFNTTVEISRLIKKKSKFKRIIMINRKEYIRRNKIKQQMREEINKKT